MTKFLRFVAVLFMAVTLHQTAVSQSLSVNTTGAVANVSSILDVSSTSKGVLIPRMDKTQKNAIATPATGLLIYQTLPDSIGFHYYNGTVWVWLANGNPLSDTINWKTHGNTGLTTATSFLGNIDNVPISFRVNNDRVGKFDRSRLNYFIGRGAGNDLGVGHVAIGDSAGSAINNNFPGVYIGYRSGIYNTGTNNTFVGSWSGQATTTGASNAFFGTDAGFSNTTGAENTFLGHFAATSNKTGAGNVAVGLQALTSDTSGSLNTAVGYQAAFATDSADLTTFIGTYAGYYNRNDYNTSVGAYSLTYNNFTTGSNTTGAENTGLGYGAGYRINLGSQNTAVGYQSMNSGGGPYISGNRNVAVGDSSLFFFSAGNDNVGLGYKALSNAQTGSQSVAVGSRALRNFSGTYPNTAIGYSSMDSAVTNGANTAVGSYTLTANKTGINNVAVGNAAMFQSTLGNDNTAVGNDAGRFIRANQNTVLGASALRNDSTGTNNIAIGYRAAYTADSISSVVAIGTDALYYNRADSNIAIGYRAGFYSGFNLTSIPKEQTFVGNNAGIGAFVSSKNTAIGFNALMQRSATGTYTDYYPGGGRNTVIGDSAMAGGWGAFNVAIGTEVMSRSGAFTLGNVAIGDSAMANSVSPTDNVAVGYKSLTQVKNQGNVAMGAYAGQKLANTVWNTAIGYHALETDTTGSENTVIGTSAFRSNANGIRNVSLGINTGYWATGSNNTYLGSYAGQGFTGRSTGGSNTAVGDYALTDIRSGSQNVAMGESALGSDSTGSLNVSIGAGSMENHLRGNDNVAMGFWAGRLDTAAAGAVYIGREAGYFNQRDYTVAIGYQALRNNGSGATLVTQAAGNTALGYTAGNTNTIGVNNTLLGYNADVSANNLSNATAIGANAVVAQSNSLILGQAGTSVGIGTTTPGALLDVTGTFSLGVNGTVLTEAIKAAVTLTVPSVTAGNTAIQLFTVPNAITGSSVMVSPSGALTNGLIMAYARVSAANTVEVKFTNTTGSTITPALLTYYITVIR